MTLAPKRANRNPSNASLALCDRLPFVAGGRMKCFSIFFELDF